MVDDASAAVTSMVEAGASIVFPIQEFLGERMARLRDPFGHLWLIRQRLEELSRSEIQAERDALFARFVPSAASLESAVPRTEETHTLDESSTRVHLVVGPVGAGKSTVALELAREHGALRFALDEWMVELFSPDRPREGVVEWYVERAERCVNRIWAVAKRIVEAGTSVVLELGLLRCSERERFYERLEDAGFDSTIHVIDAPRDVRRERVNERNRTKGDTFSMVVPPDIFELASDLWEPPSASECAGRDVRFVGADG
jgi:predicted kinase